MEKENYKKSDRILNQERNLEKLTKPELIKRYQHRGKINGIWGTINLIAIITFGIFLFGGLSEIGNIVQEERDILSKNMGSEICESNDLGEVFSVHHNSQEMMKVECEEGDIYFKKKYTWNP